MNENYQDENTDDSLSDKLEKLVEEDYTSQVRYW